MWDKYYLPVAIAKQCPLHFRAYDMHLTCYRHACMSSVSLICVDKITKYLRFWFLKFFFIENWMLFYSICLCLNLLQYCTDNRFLSLCNSNCRKLVKLMNGFNWLFSHHISMLCCSRWPMLLHRVKQSKQCQIPCYRLVHE